MAGFYTHFLYVIPRINQYFDGKRTDDEIMYRADITRRQLREVLHQYEEFVSVSIPRTNRSNHLTQSQLLTSLHPA